jgi:hypothetical protein
MKTQLIRAAAILGLGVVAAPALAQQEDLLCAERSAIVERLGAQYGEVRTGGGLLDRDQMLEIWSAPDSGSWTALLTKADGTTCIVGSGMYWQQGLPEPVPAGTKM